MIHFTDVLKTTKNNAFNADSEEDASVVRFVFGGPFGCCVDTSPLAVEGLNHKRLPEKKNTLPCLHDVLHTHWRICQCAVLYNNAELSTVLKTSIQRLFPQRGRILPVLSAPPAVQLSALGAHLDFLLHARSRAPLLPKPRRQDVSRTPGASFLFLCCSNLFYLHGWRTVGGRVKWYGGSRCHSLRRECTSYHRYWQTILLVLTGEDDSLALKKKVTIDDVFGPDLHIHDPDAKWLSGEATLCLLVPLWCHT